MSTNYGYSAFILNDSDASKLLKMFPPKFNDVFAHHTTIDFNIPETTELPINAVTKIVGYATDNHGLEALIVSVNGSIIRTDGSVYHITWSLNKNEGYTPVDSNKVIQEYGFKKLKNQININMTPEFISFKGNKK